MFVQQQNKVNTKQQEIEKKKNTQQVQHQQLHQQQQQKAHNQAIVPIYNTPSTFPFATNINTFGPAMSACLLIKDENPRLIEWLAYHYHVLNLRYLIVAVDPDSLTSPASVLHRNRTYMDITQWSDPDYMNTTHLATRLQTKLQALSNSNAKELIQLHRDRQKTFLAQCNLYHQMYNRTWVVHVDVDEFITFNYVHDHEPKVDDYGGVNPVRQRLPLLGDMSVFEFMQHEREQKESPWKDKSCIGMVRVLFGSKLDTSSTNSTASIVNPQLQPGEHYDTLSYFYHEPLDKLGAYGKQKVIMDVSRIHPSLLQPSKISIHTPIMRPRHVCPVNYFTNKSYAESFLRVQHYIGSWEAYSSKLDVRRDAEIYFDRANVTSGPIYDVRSWRESFGRKMGEEVARELLEGVGVMEEQWKTVVKKNKEEENVRPSCALLFFRTFGDKELEEGVVKALKKNILEVNPTC